jgi:hypothetical protein
MTQGFLKKVCSTDLRLAETILHTLEFFTHLSLNLQEAYNFAKYRQVSFMQWEQYLLHYKNT